MSKVVRHDTRFIEVQKLLQEVVATDFVRAYEYAQIFETNEVGGKRVSYRAIHFFGQHFNFDAYAERQQEGTSFKETVQAFKTDMGQINSWLKDLEKFKISNNERNLQVESRTLKADLTAICQESLNKCRTLLVSVALWLVVVPICLLSMIHTQSRKPSKCDPKCSCQHGNGFSQGRSNV